jgi:peptidylprolyl isomerase/FKBP-type peptidyl-prolyl cis-trans isomerase FklB
MLMRLFVIALAAASLSACHAGAKSSKTEAAATTPAASEPTPEGKAFLAKTAKAPGVKALPDGLLYKVVHSGPPTGLKPQVGDEIKVHYEGKLIDGTVFDSSYERGQPAAMPLEHLIKAWEEALPMMRPGDEWTLYVPPSLGYGAEGGGDVIPPNAVLIFRIELIDVLPRPGRVKQG